MLVRSRVIEEVINGQENIAATINDESVDEVQDWRAGGRDHEAEALTKVFKGQEPVTARQAVKILEDQEHLETVSGIEINLKALKVVAVIFVQDVESPGDIIVA